MIKKTPNAEIAAVFDADSERTRMIAAKFDVARTCTSFEDLVGGDDIDVVYIAAPNVFHMEQTIAAAKAGKHILCEKPLGMNAEQCRQMVEVCRKQGVKLAVDFWAPFAPAQQRVMELIQEGVIGKVSFIYLSMNVGGYGDLDAIGWRADPKMAGGGPLMDLAVNVIYLACFFLDDKVESVMARVRPQKTETLIETDVLALLEFSRGARVAMDTSYVRGNRHNYTIVGDKGQIHVTGTMGWTAGGRIMLRRGIEMEDELVSFEKGHGFERFCTLFCQAVEENKDAPVPGRAGLHVQAVIDAIYESGQTGKMCIVKE